VSPPRSLAEAAKRDDLAGREARMALLLAAEGDATSAARCAYHAGLHAARPVRQRSTLWSVIAELAAKDIPTKLLWSLYCPHGKASYASFCQRLARLQPRRPRKS